MRSRSLLAGAIVLAVVGLAVESRPAAAGPPPSDELPAVAPPFPTRPPATLADLAVDAPAAANRAVSFTNHRSAFFYTQTHGNDHAEHAWFRGFNVAGRRVFSDYRLTLHGVAIDPTDATSVIVRPDMLVRTYGSGMTENLRLYDDRDVVSVEVRGASGPIALSIQGEMVRADGSSGQMRLYVSASETGDVRPTIVAVTRRSDTFLICAGPSRDAAAAICRDGVQNESKWREERRARLERTINGSQYVATTDARLTESLRWIALTTEQLVTRQRGDGIYAGLPWFPEYWGRDSFIALPGAALVTGQFEAARAILTSFAKFQDLGKASPFYGRVPNIVKPGSLDYHTTDGTPRFVIALRDYLRYTGDATLLRELYPNVTASIDGSLARFTDEHGLLMHADNETWMDARRASDLAAYAPRGNRANDIQALWYQQLLAGVAFAEQLGDRAAAVRWQVAADRVRRGFDELFVSRAGQGGAVAVADHVTAEGRADATLRPNVLFALDMLPESEAAAITARVWQTLVFPWGVATLDPGERFFHPYHLAPGCWHKDEAYHNGTVWPWLDGVFIDQLVRFGQVEPAWQLFIARSRLALERGVVGGLPETLDAYPHPGESQPRLTGTYLQAWSNAEHLRAWYQDFLGVRPQLEAGHVLVAPRLPKGFGGVDFNARVGAGTLRGVYEPRESGRRYRWLISGLATQLVVDLPPYAVQSFELRDGEQLMVDVARDSARAALYAPDGRRRNVATLEPSPERSSKQREWDALFARSGFAVPKPLTDLSIGCDSSVAR